MARKIKRQRAGGKERDWKKMKNIKPPKCKGKSFMERCDSVDLLRKFWLSCRDYIGRARG